ncbi:MAG: glycoside hydrolase family 125 protein [Clostridia bacterium]|nr:glycoside hydrolase family 125 protein [Clostridia bacterium]
MNIPAPMQAYIDGLLAKTSDPTLKSLFADCFLNTWTTTIQETADDAFVITGDIPAMWLRDSSAQVKNYLKLMPVSDEITAMVRKVINRQMLSITKDPYANAFNFEGNAHGHTDDRPLQSPWVWERKYEIDSLCYPVHLAYQYWKISGKADIFTETAKTAFGLILKTWKTEQNHADSPYYFLRDNCPPTDTLTNDGKGTPVAPTGMTWSGFRPSDDACTYGYLVPANMFAVVALREMAEILRAVYGDEAMAAEADALKAEIDAGIQKYAIVETAEFGKVYAYEVDGLGNHLFMDDANVPSLMSAPYLGYCDVSDPIYQNTRKLLLSNANPYYHEGKAAKGIGSPHTPADSIWPIAMAMQGLTATDAAEKKELLGFLLASNAGTGFMHESFHKDDAKNFTRPWFAWANTICSEFFIDCIENGLA